MRVIDFSDGFSSTVQPQLVVAPATEVSVTPSGNLASTNAQAALEELQLDVDTRAKALNPVLTGTLDSSATTTSTISTSNVSSAVSIGTGSGSNTINIGGANSTIILSGTSIIENTVNKGVQDKLITINKGGATLTGGGTGLEIEEAAAITGYVKTSGDRNSFEFKVPNTAGVVTLTTGAAVDSVVLVAGTQTLLNKTLTSPVINAPTGIVKGDVGLGLVDNTSDATKNAAAATLTNKTISGAANTITNIPLTTAVAGTLPIANGGTGQDTAGAALNALLPTQATHTGKYLTTDGSNTSWAAVASGGSSALVIQTKSAAYTVLATDDLVIGNATTAAFTLTLPTPVGNSGKVLRLQKALADVSFNAITVSGTGLSTTLNTFGEVIKIVSDNTNWILIARNYPGTSTLYTPTTQGFGSPTQYAVHWRRDGAWIRIQGRFLLGSTTAVEARLGLPSGITIAPNFANGVAANNYAGAAILSALNAATDDFTVLGYDLQSYVTFGNKPTNTSFGNINGNSFAGNYYLGFDVSVPVNGWN